jgi:hypothetical protein
MSGTIVKKEVKEIGHDDSFDLDVAKDSFFDKHPPLTEEEIEDAKEESREAKGKYTRDLQAVENNLLQFLKEQEHPVIDKESGKVIFWIKEIPYWKLVEIVPEELQDRSIPEEERTIIAQSNKEYQLQTFKLMELVISRPEKDWEWWRDHASPRLMGIFEKAIENMFKKMETEISFF